MSDISRLLRLRVRMKKKRPKFLRQESWRYKRIKPSWRRAKGIDNKVRKKKKGTISSPNIGYRTPKKVRNLHPSGFEEVIVHNLAELEKVNPKTQVVKLARTLGRHKRVLLQDRADELNILILNRSRILLPGEELLLEEGRGFEKEEITSFEEAEISEEIEESEDLEILDEIEADETSEE